MSSIIEKKPLLIRIPGEKEPNELPISASAVGYDVNTGNYIYYSTGSDSWTAVPSTGTVATASYASNADLLDNLDSTAFARLSVSNIFTANQVVTGSITATVGLSGSLTRLSDGTPYLFAGTNITLVTESNGAITISSSGGSGSPGGSSTHVQFNNAGAFGGSANFTWNGTNIFVTGGLNQGNSNIASGLYSHAEGNLTIASGSYSHAEGDQTVASVSFAHAEGRSTTASGTGAHAEGIATIATGSGAHAEGRLTVASGLSSHAEGEYTLASGNYSHAEGNYVTGSGLYSHAEGQLTLADGTISHAEGLRTRAQGGGAHSEGNETLASGQYSHAEGYQCTGSTDYAHAEGDRNVASGYGTHAEGQQTSAIGSRGHTEGRSTIVALSGYAGHAEGYLTIVSGNYAHAEGQSTVASGQSSHSEGFTTTASGLYSHAEGDNAIASGQAAHAEGRFTVASGQSSHAEGQNTISSGSYSHAEGLGTIASGSNQHVQGKYNLRNNNFSLFVIGDGTGDADGVRGDILRVNSGSSIGTGRVEVTGSFVATRGLSGSLTRLSDGTPYLLAGTNITLSTGSSGAVTINSTAAGASTTNYFLSLNGTANGISTNIGSFYAASAITLSTGSVAYIGGSSASETAILKLSPIGSTTATVTWTRTNLLGSVALTGSVALSAGWYDLILDVSGAMQTAFARGLYLTT